MLLRSPLPQSAAGTHTTTHCCLLLTGTQHGDTLCARNAGVARPGLNGVEYGHHFFQIDVQIPNSQGASAAELQLLQQLADLLGGVRQGQQQHQQAGQLQQGQQQPGQIEGAAAAGQAYAAAGIQDRNADAAHADVSSSQGPEQDQHQQQQESARSCAAGSGQHLLQHSLDQS